MSPFHVARFRAARLTPEQRREIARKAVLARWAKARRSRRALLVIAEVSRATLTDCSRRCLAARAVSWSCHSSQVCLPQRGINLYRIEADDHRAINYHNGGSHVPELLQFFQSGRILGDVLVLELDILLRKILFRLAAEHSTGLGINYDSLHVDLTLAVQFQQTGALFRPDHAPSSLRPAFHPQRWREQNGCRVPFPFLRPSGLSCPAQKHHMRDMQCSGKAERFRRSPTSSAEDFNFLRTVVTAHIACGGVFSANRGQS